MAPKSPIKRFSGLLGTGNGHRLAKKGIACDGELKNSGHVHTSTTIVPPGTAIKDAGTDPTGSPLSNSSESLTTGARSRRETMTGAASGSPSSGTNSALMSLRKVGSAEAQPLVAGVSIDCKLSVLSNVSRAPNLSGLAQEVHDAAATPSQVPLLSQTLAATLLPPSPVPVYLEWCVQQNQKHVHPNIEIPEPDAPGLSHSDTHLPPRARWRLRKQRPPAIHFPEAVQWRVCAHLYHADRPALARLNRVSGDWYEASRIEPQFVLDYMMTKESPFRMIAWVPGIAPRVQKPSYDVIHRYCAHRRVRLGLPPNGMLRSYSARPVKPSDATTEDEFKAMFTEIPGTPDQIYLVWADPDVDVDDQHHFGLRLVPGVSLLRVPPHSFRTCLLRRRVPEYRMPQAIPPQITTLVVAGPVAPEGVKNFLNIAGQYLHLTTLHIEIPKLLALKLPSAMVLPDADLTRVMTSVGRSVRVLELNAVIGKQTAQTIAQQP
ncbi:hypothetical protein GGF31_000620 [Allomyces arbusculus]|nr:hypothetical protein GGF31_000620 [Allomyces arbusculus]